MKRSWFAIGLVFIAPFALAQTGSGAIIGTITDGETVVRGATVRANNIATGTVYTAISTSTGEFNLSNLPAGTYEISVPPLGLRTEKYVQTGITVQAGQAVRSDVRLILGNLGVVGDDGASVAILNKYAGLTGPTPRTPEGKPDFSGMWQASVDPDPEPPSSLPWVTEVMNQRIANNFVDAPNASCLPAFPFPLFPILYKIVQAPGLLLQLFEAFDPHYRQVFLDGRAHPTDPDPTWLGHSIGKWDGDTLVIDTIGFNDKSWLGLEGLPHTEMMHVIERYRRPDLAHLKIDVSIEDPGAFSKPFERHMTWDLAPGEELLEFICNENNKNLENLGKK